MALDILVVDDERDIRDLVSGVLSDEGYECRVAGDSGTALRLAVAAQQQAEIVEPGDDALQLHALDQKHRDRRLFTPQQVEEGILQPRLLVVRSTGSSRARRCRPRGLPRRCGRGRSGLGHASDFVVGGLGFGAN